MVHCNSRGLVVLSQTVRVLFWWLTPPTSVFLDTNSRQLWVANYLSNSVVMFSLF